MVMKWTNSEEYKQEVLIKDVSCCCYAIRICAEGTRVEDTMTRIAKLGYSEVTALLQTLSSSLHYIRNRFLGIFRITSRDTNLIKFLKLIKFRVKLQTMKFLLAE